MSKQRQEWLQELKSTIAKYLGDDADLITADRTLVTKAMTSPIPQVRLAALLLIRFFHGIEEQDLTVMLDRLIIDSDEVVQQNAIGIVAEYGAGTCDTLIANALLNAYESASPYMRYRVEHAMSVLLGEHDNDNDGTLESAVLYEARFAIMDRLRR